MNDALKTIRRTNILSLDDAAAFHGHLGPFLVLGYRLGAYAVKLLKPRDEFDLNAFVYIPLKTPFSCILDGIQCATKCTLGKWNIQWIDSDDFRIEFICKSTGQKIIMKIKPEIIEEALECKDLEKESGRLIAMKIEEIAYIQRY